MYATTMKSVRYLYGSLLLTRRCLSVKSQSYTSHPLYYKLLNHQNRDVLGLSFLSDFPQHSIIGWFESSPKIRIPFQESSGDEFIKHSVSTFVSNPSFEELLHTVIRDHIHQDETTQAFANNQNVGYLNINDNRVFSPWGRVNDPEDIFGSICLDGEGKMIPGTYQKMNTHRILTPHNGLFQLNDFLQSKLLEALKKY